MSERFPFSNWKNVSRGNRSSQMIRSDVCGYIHVETPDGAKFFVLFTDDFEPTEERETDVTHILSDERFLTRSRSLHLIHVFLIYVMQLILRQSSFSNFFFNSSLTFSIVMFEGECRKWYKHLLTWPLDGSSIPCMMTGPWILVVYFTSPAV